MRKENCAMTPALTNPLPLPEAGNHENPALA